jgi:serine protease AprX
MLTAPCRRNRELSALLRLLLVVTFAVGVIGMPADAAAQQGTRTWRARVSRDLDRELRNGNSRHETVILTGSQERVDRVASRHGLAVKKRLATGAVLEVPAGSLLGLAEDADVDQLSSNQTLRSQMAVTNATIGADLVQGGQWVEGGRQSWWRKRIRAFNGEGVGIAVIDSGVAVMPELRGTVIARVDFTDNAGRGLDKYGHGTHVAGIIAAHAASKTDTTRGVAPGAHIVSLKVLDSNGVGTADNVIEAIDWAIKYKQRFNIKVINMSLGGAVLQPAADDPLCQAVERAYRAGIIVVTSAGNHGKTVDGTPIYGAITTPGISPFAITVGALNTKGTSSRDDDEVASYSSKGPTRFDHLIKPDLVAPGNKIAGLAAPNSTLVNNHPELVTGTGTSKRLTLSGTSMAAGVVSGAVAAILNAHPKAGPFAVKTSLQLGARAVAGGLLQTGAGSLDIPRSLELPKDPEAFAFSALSLWHDAVATGQVVRGDLATIIWGGTDTIIWGGSFDVDETIIWGGSFDFDETIIWGGSFDFDETIIWGGSFDFDETIIWGGSFDFDETIIWGGSFDFDETIIWGGGVTAGD